MWVGEDLGTRGGIGVKGMNGEWLVARAMQKEVLACSWFAAARAKEAF